MAYKKTEPKVNFSELEREVLEFWRKDDTFHKSLEKTKMGEPFNFYDGPPFANGLPHWGLDVRSGADGVPGERVQGSQPSCLFPGRWMV